MSADSKQNDRLERPRRARVAHSKEQTGYLVRCRNLFYLSLTLLVLVDLLDTARRFGQSFRTADVLAGVAPLDSFSEPAIAATLLRREADNLFSSFIEARDGGEYPAASHPEPLSRAEFASDSIGSKPRKMSAAEIQLLQRLQKLRATIRELNRDVDEKLLVIDLRTQKANDLVNCFLELLHNCPERPEMLEWVDPALDSAASSGRAEEVQDALKHVLRFQKSLPTAWGLKMRIERRKESLSAVRTRTDQ